MRSTAVPATEFIFHHAIAALAIGISGCGVQKNNAAVAPAPAATAPTLTPISNPTCRPVSTQASSPNPAPLLVGYFFADKGKHYADYVKQIDFKKMTHLNLAFGVPPKCDGVCNASSNMEFSIQGQSDADSAAIVAARMLPA